MKKFFFLALMAFLWLPATTWADEHTGDENDSGNVEDGGSGDFWDDEQEGTGDNLGSIVPSEVQLAYAVLSNPTGDYGEEGYEPGTVELERLYYSPSGSVGALSIPHEIQVVNVDVNTLHVDIALYTVIGIGDNAFTEDATITALTIPYTVQYVGANAFQNCSNLTSLSITDTTGNPSELTTIGDYAFEHPVGFFGSDNGITSLDLPASLQTIGDYAFHRNSLKSLNLSEGLTSIGQYAFSDCDELETLEIPSTVTTISNYAFYICGGLTTVTMSGATTLGASAFGSCQYLTTLVLTDSNTTGGAATGVDPFYGDERDNITVYVPTGSAATYLSSGWNTLVENDSELSWNFFSTSVSDAGWDGENTYYATYYVDEEGYILDGGTAYYVSGVTDDAVVTTAINGIIPVNTAILIGSSAAGDYYFYNEYEPTTEATITGNMLYGTNNEAGIYTVGPDEGVDYYFYKLSQNAGGEAGTAGFYWDVEEGGAFTCPAYRAYLAVPQDVANGINYISFKKSEDDTTGISAVESASEKTVSGIYTIQGVRVSNMNQPGLYIVDGKKVLVK